jgi:uncharacterized protein with NAD-binding domain and iron-sulfur cluster
MMMKLGDKFKVMSRGSEPFSWDLINDVDEETALIEVNVVEPDEYCTKMYELGDSLVWDNENYGELVTVAEPGGFTQWVPLTSIQPV